MNIVARLRAGILVTALLVSAVQAAAAQTTETRREREGRLARRNLGARVGTWNVDVPAADTTELSRSLRYELYYQRGLDRHLGLENSFAVWRRVTNEIQRLPSGGERAVETRTYIIPLLTSLKFYPVTEPSNLIDPYLTGGVGFALGIVDEAENAIGGGGISIVTGFAVRTGIGVEIHVTPRVGLLASGRYEWMRFGSDLGSKDVFNGAGADGGIIYRFRF